MYLAMRQDYVYLAKRQDYGLHNNNDYFDF